MKDISVLTLNLHTYQEKNVLEKLNRVADLIAELKPAFVCLQECAQHKDSEPVTDIRASYQQANDNLKKDNMAYLISARLKNKYGISYNYYWSWAHYGWGVWEEGVAVMTHYKIKEAEVRYISKQKTRTSIYSRIATYISADVRGKGRFNLFSVHASWWNSGQSEQITAVKQFVQEKAKNKPVSSITCGDFNANAGGKGYHVLVSQKVLPLIDSYAEVNLTGFDDSTILGGGRIDYIFYYPPKSLRPTVSQLCFREKTGPQAKVSDHYGVITRFKIP